MGKFYRISTVLLLCLVAMAILQSCQKCTTCTTECIGLDQAGRNFNQSTIHEQVCGSSDIDDADGMVKVTTEYIAGNKITKTCVTKCK